MRSSCAVVVVAMAGCGFQAPSAQPGGEIDAGRSIDAGPPDACVTFSSQLDTCALAFAGDLVISENATYDTTAHTLRTQGGATIDVSTVALHTLGDDVDAIYARSIRLAPGVTLRATGSTAFAMLALDRIALDAGAIVDVSAGGAGARTSCEKPAKAGDDASGGAAGGGGGGYGAAGGDGGNGNSDGFSQSKGGAKGDATADLPAGPRGGCPGAKGGNSSEPGGSGGLAGGAVFLAAGARIDLAAAAGVNAGGGGGRGGARSSGDGDAGGGGGASGGYILVEAPHIAGPAATLAANGGGGGEGSGDAKAGLDGTAGRLSGDRAPGGGNNSPTGIDGGLGGAASILTGDRPTAVDKGGGGGGGGGVGFIHLASSDAVLGNLSPAAR